MRKQNLSHYFEWVSAAISPFPWQCSDLYVMENQQRGKFTEKQNKANKTNNASSKTAKAVLLWWIYSKWKNPRTKDIVNTFQKKMDKETKKLNCELKAQMKCLCAFNSIVPAIWIFSQRCKVVKGSAKLK